MKTVYMKSLLIATVLLFSINGCNNENISLETPDTEPTEERTERHTDSRHIVASSGARGWQYFWEGDYESSLEMLYLTLELVESRDLPQIANYYSRLGVLHYRLGNYEQSEYYFNKALKITQIGNDIPTRLRALRNFVSLHASRGDMGQFEVAMDIKEAVRDSLIIKQQQMKYKAERKNDLLARKTEDVQRKWTIIIFLKVIITLITSLSIFVILFQRRKKRESATAVRHYEEILKLKKEVHPQHTESEKSDEKANEKADESKQLASDIQQLFETEKIYRQQGLSVDDVATRLEVPPRLLSNAISQHYQKNFMEYVNTFRVEEAIEMLKQQNKGEKYAHLTIQAIGEEVGFNGKTTFYRAFNQIVGVTPSEYIENINGKNKQ